MRIIIAGSRSITGPAGITAVKQAIKESGWTPTEIISGHASGVDTIGEALAKELNVDLAIFPANWKGHGKAAGFKRNRKMAWYANLFNKEYAEKEEECPERLKGALVAIWDGKSRGTQSMIELAKEISLPFFILKVDTKSD